MTRTLRTLAAATTLAVLAACSGGTDSTEAPTGPADEGNVPAACRTLVTAATDYFTAQDRLVKASRAALAAALSNTPDQVATDEATNARVASSQAAALWNSINANVPTDCINISLRALTVQSAYLEALSTSSQASADTIANVDGAAAKARADWDAFTR